MPSTEYFSKEVFSKDLRTYKIVEPGMFAYNPSRINVGSVNYWNGSGAVVVSPLYVVVKIDESKIRQDYLNFFLHSSEALNQIHNLTEGTVRDSLKFSAFVKVQISLPALPEQKRIAEELDRICELKKNAEERLALMDQLVKSRFVEMFGECDDLVRLDQVGQIYTGSTPPMKVPEYYDSNDIPFVKPSDLSFEISQVVTSECFVSKKAEPVVRMFDPGAVLVTCIGATIGKMGVARVRGTCNQQINFVVPSSNIEPEFLALALQSKKDELVRSANSTAVPILNKSQFSKIQLPLPPIGEQRKFAAFVAEVDKSKSILRETVAKMETLYKAKLQEYFG